MFPNNVNSEFFKLVYTKKYFSFTKIFQVPIPTECLRLEQRSVIKFLVADKCQPRMCDVRGEACFCQKMYTDWLNNLNKV